MSKHPTSELSPRDMACIEYGKALRHLSDEYVARHYTYEYEYVEELIKNCRAARERIFRECSGCIFSISFSFLGWECAKASERHPGEHACICPNYEERSQKK